MERIKILPHQLEGILTGAEGRSPLQTNRIKELGRYPASRFDTSTGASVICEVCPINPESEHFDPEAGETCDKESLFFEMENIDP